MDIDVKALLHRLRQDAPGCRAAALVDLDAHMVLTDDADPPVGQEVWDNLAAKAVDLLVGPSAQTLARRMNQSQLGSAVLTRSDTQILLIRSAAEPPLGMMFICYRNVATANLQVAATKELEVLAASD